MRRPGWREWSLAIAVAVLSLAAQPSGGQNTHTGEIKGIVTDPSGAVIPNGHRANSHAATASGRGPASAEAGG
jgi:hypothetical protein